MYNYLGNDFKFGRKHIAVAAPWRIKVNKPRLLLIVVEYEPLKVVVVQGECLGGEKVCRPGIQVVHIAHPALILLRLVDAK